MDIQTVSAGVLRRNNVQIAGNPHGRPLVFAHGFGCSLEVWRFVSPRFLDENLVVLYDAVGAGNSDPAAYDPGKYDSLHGYADDLLEILDDLDLDDVVFVGHSVSAMVGVLASARCPGRFGALVLVGPSPRYLNDADYVGGFEGPDIDALLDSLDSNYLGWSTAMAPVIIGNSDRPELGDDLTASFCRIDPAIARHFARVTFLSDTRHDLAQVTVPTLVLQCTDDVIAPLTVGTYVAEQISSSTLVVMAATGHCPSLSAPEELVSEIKRFLR